ALSPDGRTVVVTGAATNFNVTPTPSEYATVAYRASTGAQLWAALYDNAGNDASAAQSVAFSPSGERIFVTGISQKADSGGSGRVLATVAYQADTGAQAWIARYPSSTANDVAV